MKEKADHLPAYWMFDEDGNRIDCPKLDKTDQSLAYWLHAYTGGRDRKIGVMFTASTDAPAEIRGKRILYRWEKRWENTYFRRDRSVGFDLAVFNFADFVLEVAYVVTFAKDIEQMNIAPVGAFSFQENYGQGLQKRAYILDTKTLPNAKELRFPKAVRHIWVRSEDPEDEDNSQQNKEEKPKTPNSSNSQLPFSF